MTPDVSDQSTAAPDAPSAVSMLTGASTALSTTIPAPLSTGEAAKVALDEIDIAARWIASAKRGVFGQMADHFKSGMRKYEAYRQGAEYAEMLNNAANGLRELEAAQDRIRADNEALKTAAINDAKTAADGERKAILQAAREDAQKLLDGVRTLAAEIETTLATRKDELVKIEASIHRAKMERDRLINSLRTGAQAGQS